MPISRRQLIAGIGAAGGALAVPIRGGAQERGARVIVRNERGTLAVDPRTGDLESWDDPLPATPDPSGETTPVPDVVATPVTEGAVGYWMTDPDATAFVFRVDTGASSAWWWRRGGDRPVALDLPGDLEPAFPSGASARWFHGATIDATHLGSGTLRLLAIDVATGEMVLNHALDRRLELAATRVSADGAVVAHVQPATTGVAFWAADLRGGTRLFEAGVEEEPGPAAASAIELDAIADEEGILVATGVIRDWPGAPGPTVYTLWSAPSEVTRTVTLSGELIGIIPPGLHTRP
jgi:hypothetical protein